MSFFVDWARRQTAGGFYEKSLLVLLALRVDARGVCVVSRADLAAMSEMPRNNVERALVTLEGRGLIFRAARAETSEIRLLTGDGK